MLALASLYLLLRVFILSEYFDRAARLKKARIDRGFKTARLAAEYMGIPYGTYSGHENGSRGIKEPELLNYAKLFRVSPSWLAFGDQDTSLRVKISGVVTGTGTMDAGSLKKARMKEVTPPFAVPVGVTALSISTNEFAPHLRENDVVLVGARTSAASLLNQRVAISFKGAILVGTLLSSAKTNHFHIQLFNGQISLDIEPTWTAPIIGVLYRT